MKNAKNIKDFIIGYKSGILFTEMGEDEESLDSNYGIFDFDSKSDEQIQKMAEKYISENESSIKASGMDYEQVGTDVWFAQSGQGAGFFDRSLDDDIEKKLTASAKKFSDLSHNVFAQDGKVYIEGLKIDKLAKGTTLKNYKSSDLPKDGSEIKIFMPKLGDFPAENIVLKYNKANFSFDAYRGGKFTSSRVSEKQVLENLNNGLYEIEKDYKIKKLSKGSKVDSRIEKMIKDMAVKNNGTVNYILDKENDGMTLDFNFPTPQDRENFKEELQKMNNGTLRFSIGGNMPESFEYSIGGL